MPAFSLEVQPLPYCSALPLPICSLRISTRLDAAYSLTAHNACSSPLTLKIMLVVVVLFVPIVLAYQIWTYHFFKGKVTQEDMI